jgi:hypothetical protein
MNRRRFVQVAGTMVAAGGAKLPSHADGVDLVTPEMTDDAPAPGRRVRQVAPECEGTDVYHFVYLPTDWREGETYPVIVEYTGNLFLACGSTGEVKGANLGYGLTGGQGFIWVGMAYVEKGRKRNAVTWWGVLEATLEYCKINVPRICDQFGGDPDNVFLCGFSRGAIACNFLGLADDQIAGLWKGFITHDHYDGVREWPYEGCDRSSALGRLKRLDGRPQLICQAPSTREIREYLQPHAGLGEFSFLDVPVTELFDIPEGKVIHPHTDLWMSKDSPQRRRAREWLANVASRAGA